MIAHEPCLRLRRVVPEGEGNHSSVRATSCYVDDNLWISFVMAAARFKLVEKEACPSVKKTAPPVQNVEQKLKHKK